MLKRIVASTLAALFLVTFGTASVATAGKPVAGKVNINNASAAQLTSLPGIGPKLAERIVEYRQKSGGFKSVQELMNVRGIGEKSFQKLQPHLVLSETKTAGAN